MRYSPSEVAGVDRQRLRTLKQIRICVLVGHQNSLLNHLEIHSTVSNRNSNSQKPKHLRRLFSLS